MAERRMFSKRIISTARFLKMPVSTQCLYFHLGLNADDDGIVEAYTVMNSIGATEDDLKILVAKDFVCVLNEDLVTFILDWKENNKIRADRKVDSIYKNLLFQVLPDADLLKKKQRSDTKKKDVELVQTTDGQPTDNQWTSSGQPMDRIGKDRLGKDSIGKDSIDNNIVEPKEKNCGREIISLPLNDKTNHIVYEKELNEFKELYPAVDIEQELRKMKGWLIANPSKRKTRRGVMRFVNSWLSRCQDSGQRNAGGGANGDTRKRDGSMYAELS